MLCYMYKIHLGIVPDLGFLSEDKGRNGPQYIPKHHPAAPADIHAVRMSSFFCQGPKLFNLLPLQLRQTKTPADKAEAKKLFDRFKHRLDKWLELIPDDPHTGRPPKRNIDPNAIEAQMKKHGVEIRRQWEIVFWKLEREEAAAENNKGDSTGNTNSNSKKRKSKYERTAEASAKGARNNVNKDWEGWL